MLFGVFLSAFAGLGCLSALHALIDPKEAQLSNDADPFGTPPPTSESLLHLLVWLTLFSVGLWLVFKKNSKPNLKEK
jgi:hypothetical protein